MPVTKTQAAASQAAPAGTPAPGPVDAFVPLNVLQNTLRSWWVVVVLIIAGGLLGWMIHSLRPPLYEAVGEFTASIDYVSTGPLTQFEEDTAFTAVTSIIFSHSVIEQVVERAGSEGITTSVSEIRQPASVERKLNVWTLRVRNADPRLAERIANIWIEQASAALTESYRHALLAAQLERTSQSLEKCLLKAVASQPSYGLCDGARFSDIQKDLVAASKILHTERVASRGMFSGLVPGQFEPAQVSKQPVANQRNQFVMAGALLGLLLGIVLVELGLPSLWFKRK